jgi:hypothetical protein
VDRALSLWVIPWHLPYNWGKIMYNWSTNEDDDGDDIEEEEEENMIKTTHWVLLNLAWPIPRCHWQSQHNLNPTKKSANVYFISWHYGTQQTLACHRQLILVQSTITSFNNTHLATTILFTIFSPNHLLSSNQISVCIYHFLCLLKHNYLHAAGSFLRS